MTYGILIQDRDELVYVFKRYTHIYTFEIKKRLNVFYLTRRRLLNNQFTNKLYEDSPRD